MLTDIEKNMIRSMRIEGLGYKSIAIKLNISRDRVRSYCKTHLLNGVAAVAILNNEEQIRRALICWHCGEPIIQAKKGTRKKFCCDACRRKWWSAHPECKNRSKEASYKLICEHCGKKFVSYGNKNRKFCSHDCYIKERFWNV